MNPEQTEITPELKARREALDKMRKWGEEEKGWAKKKPQETPEDIERKKLLKSIPF